jgi:GNAT superfamily N-acetyltransferase
MSQSDSFVKEAEMEQPSSVELSAIDSERFSVRVARANRVTTANLPEILNFCNSTHVDLLIARSNTQDVTAAQSMEKHGFSIMDTLVYYTFDLTKRSIPEDSCKARVRFCRPQDQSKVREIAAATFAGYRGHYHADARLDDNKCDQAYVSWAEHSCVSKDVADEVLVAEFDGVLSGFATLRLNSAQEGEGVLFGVAPEAQGQGIYRCFMIQGMRWCKEKGLDRMCVSTQITNTAVQKVWCRVHFEPSHSYYTFHKWFTPEEK